MKIFIDTANIEEIREISAWGILEGVTTNPSLLAKEGLKVEAVIRDICSLVDGPVSAEVISMNCDEMVMEARELSKMHNNVVIKIPMCEEGLKAVAILRSEGIRTNVTLIFSAQQALLAAKAGADFVSPFVGRLDDIGNSGIDVVREIAEIFKTYGLKTEIIGASIRNTIHVLECAKAGAHIATIPYKIIKQMVKHPLTEAGVAKFLQDYQNTK